MRRIRQAVVLWGILVFGVAPSLFAQVPPSETIIVNGDEVEYFPDERKVVGTGNISIDYKGSRITADTVTVYLETKDAEAVGNVVLERGADTFYGERLRYNFETKVGTLTDAKGKVLPWYFGGEKIVREGENTFLVEEGYLTTCDLAVPHYTIRTKRIEIHPDDEVVAKNVIFQAGGVPFFYAPYYSRSLKKGEVQQAGFGLVPGFSSRWGAYALSSWGIPLGEGVRSEIHFDVRTRRGIGSGIDTSYKTRFGEGELRTYYLNDEEKQSPINRREDTDRHRTRWLHRSEITPALLFLGEYQKWSDRFISRDYFNGEYAQDFRPDTRATLVHTLEPVTSAFTVQKRVNQFFTQTERLPELQVTSQRLSLWDTGLYYLGELNAGNLTRAVAGGSDTTTERVDLFSELAYAKGISGIQFVPRISTHQTYYGKNLNGETDAVRGLVTAGFDLSTRFRRFYPMKTQFWGLELSGLRHILEPGLKYRYTPEPTLLSSQLPAFDAIDALTERNRLTFILDNKFQTRRNFGESSSVVDLVDLVLESNYDFKTDTDGKLIDLKGTLELRPSPFWGLIGDAKYDTERDEVTVANLDLFAFRDPRWRIDFLHRYEKNMANQFTSKLSWQATSRWKVELYDRFETNDLQFEEEEIILTRDLHCWEASVGVNIRDTEDLERSGSEYSVYLAFRLKAFPEAPLELGNRASISRRLIGSRRSGQTD